MALGEGATRDKRDGLLAPLGCERNSPVSGHGQGRLLPRRSIKSYVAFV